MIFGTPVTPLWMMLGGFTLLALIVLQIFVGKRKIKFGTKTMAVHRYIAYTILGVALVHGSLGLLFVNGWSLF